jgi:hypothetical protein
MALLAGPGADGVEEGLCHGEVGTGFEEAEERGVIVLVLAVVVVDDAGDASDVVMVLACDPELDFGVLQEGVGVGEHLGEVEFEGGDPVWVLGIEGAGNAEEPFDVMGLAGQGDDVDLGVGGRGVHRVRHG